MFQPFNTLYFIGLQCTLYYLTVNNIYVLIITIIIVIPDMSVSKECPSQQDARNILWDKAEKNSTNTQPCPGDTEGMVGNGY